MEYRCDELITTGNKSFSKRADLETLWQEIAWNFYVERADFTVTRSLGENFADHLTSSYPIKARQDLGNSLGSMLRPRSRTWFHVSTNRKSVDIAGKQWLEWATHLQKNAMYDTDSGFTRATKECDHDYAAFGQGVISTEMNWNNMSLLYRCHHLRDVAWMEGYSGKIERIDNKIKLPVCDMYRRHGWRENLDPKLINEYENGDKYKEIEVRHIVLPSDQYESSHKDSRTGKMRRYRQPWVSIYIDVDNECILEEVGSWTKVYTIPRWQTVSGSQYSYSPATVAALPDARLYQSIALTLLEAGEKYTHPPMIAVKEALRSDVNMYSGGITWVDEAYDERLGEVLRPVTQDRGSIGIGFEMQTDIRRAIHEAFFLNKLNLPDRGSADMTAYETAQRVQEYIRDALPIFEPMEHEYNGDLCEITFETLMRNGAFGPPQSIPDSLSGADIRFKFESPLHDSEERLKGQQYTTALGLISQTIGLDPRAANVMDVKSALKDAMLGVGTPAAWMRSEQESMEMDEMSARKQQAQEVLQTLSQGADVAKTGGEAAEAISSVMEGGNDGG